MGRLTSCSRSYQFVLGVLMVLAMAIAAPNSYAKTVSDPNHQGWSGKHPKMKPVVFKPITTKCEQCLKMAKQYNATAQQLLNSRYWVKFWHSVHENREKGKQDPYWPGKGDISEIEGKAVAANLALFDTQRAQLELHKKTVALLERQLSYLGAAVKECERTQCQLKKSSKLKGIKMGGAVSKVPFSPDTNSILASYSIDWQGPYSTKCRPCNSYVQQLNALPGWVVKADMRLKMAEIRLQYSRMVALSNAVKFSYTQYIHPDKNDFSNAEKELADIKSELQAYKNYFQGLLLKLSECEQKMCATKLNDPVSYVAPSTCPAPVAHKSISVGPNSAVGSKANFKEKTRKKAAGLATKAITGLLGFGGGGSGKSEGPNTYKDPVKSGKKLKVKSTKPKRELRTGAVFTQDGLLVSTDIRKAPGKGTFQTIYLENKRGWRLAPIALYMYEIWQDWKLSVSWTRDTYIDGQHVKHEQGGWTESWRELIAKGEELIYGEIQDVPLWEQLGFNTAVSGARSLGTLFPVSPAMLAAEPINLVVHVTQPKTDPVQTVPYLFELSLDKKGKVLVKQVEKTAAASAAPCIEHGGVVPVAAAPIADKAVNGGPQAPPPNGDKQANNPAQDQANGDDDDGRSGNGDGKDKDAKKDGGEVLPLAAKKGKDPCTNECKDLLNTANDKAAQATKQQTAADAAKQQATDADSAAKSAESAADKADEMAKELPRDDHAIINGHKYTTADTEYRVILAGKINQAHRDGNISDKEHERQTKANTNKKAQEERLKNLAKLRKEAAAARAKADAARKAANQAAQAASDAQAAADKAKAEAQAAKKAYQDCLKKAKDECEKIKAAAAKKAADAKAAEEARLAAEANAAREKELVEKRKATAEAKRLETLEEEKRLLKLIKELGLINKKVSEVPSLWGKLPDILEVPAAMFTEVQTGIPIPVDTLTAVGGLYGILGAFLNPCTSAGILRTELRLQEMINPKTGKKYTSGEAAKETTAMCNLMGKLRGRIAALKRAGNK